MDTADDDRRRVEAFLARRDEESFLALYRAHADALYRTAWRLARGVRAEAEDAVQETWLRAVGRLDGFQFRSALRTWLTGILVRCLHEARRRGERDPPASREEPEGSAGPRPAETHLDLELDLERALARLAPAMREVLVLHDVEGFTHEEVAGLLGIHAGTSKSQLFAARRRLRALLEGDDGHRAEL